MGGDDDAFDFFSDAPQQPAAVPPPVPSSDALDFDDPDGAFAFGDDDLAADLPSPGSMPTGAPIRRPDATIAMLPDPPSASDEAFDFSFESASSNDPFDTPIEADQLAHTTLLDPAAGSGFDVSSSDLEMSRAPAAATQILSLDDAEDADPLTEPESVFAAPVAPAPRAPAFDAEDPFEATVPPFRAAQREASFDSFDSDPLEDPIEVGEPLHAGEELDADDPFAPGPVLAEPVHSEPRSWEEASFEAPMTEAAIPAGTPGLAHAELRDMIEKIAWDAFGPATEKIVREAIARIEQVAWEVVPKLAETLIQEEIRKLKGGS